MKEKSGPTILIYLIKPFDEDKTVYYIACLWVHL